MAPLSCVHGWLLLLRNLRRPLACTLSQKKKKKKFFFPESVSE